MQRLMEESIDEPTTSGRQRAAIIGVALLVTAGVIALVLILGAVAYVVRFQGDHEARLARVMKLNPTLGQFMQAMENEGTKLLASPETPEELQKAAQRWGGRDRSAILERAARWPTVRVFDAHRMHYFVFFDDEGIMRDFVCSRS